MEIDKTIASFEEKIQLIKLKKLDLIFTKLSNKQTQFIHFNNLVNISLIKL